MASLPIYLSLSLSYLHPFFLHLYVPFLITDLSLLFFFFRDVGLLSDGGGGTGDPCVRFQ